MAYKYSYERAEERRKKEAKKDKTVFGGAALGVLSAAFFWANSGDVSIGNIFSDNEQPAITEAVELPNLNATPAAVQEVAQAQTVTRDYSAYPAEWQEHLQNVIDFRAIPENLAGNKEFMLLALEQSGYAIRWASDELRNDKDVIMAAIERDPFYLMLASDELKNDEEVVMAAVKQNPGAIYHAADKFKADKEMALFILEKDGSILSYMADNIQDDLDLVRVAFKQNKHAIEFASDRIKSDKDIMTDFIRSDTTALVYASDEVKFDPEVFSLIQGKYVWRELLYFYSASLSDPELLAFGEYMSDGYDGFITFLSEDKAAQFESYKQENPNWRDEAAALANETLLKNEEFETEWKWKPVIGFYPKAIPKP